MNNIIDFLDLRAIVIALIISAITDAILAMQKKAPVFFISPYLKFIAETRHLFGLVHPRDGRGENAYVDLHAIKAAGKDKETIPIIELIKKSIQAGQPVLLLGQPGAGKTTALKAAAFQYARKSYALYGVIWLILLGIAEWLLFVDPFYSLGWLCSFIVWQPLVTRAPIPILVMGKDIGDQDFTTWKNSELARIFRVNKPSAQAKRIIWLVDGVNEINNDSYVEFIKGWRADLQEPSPQKYVFTSRQVEDPSVELGISATRVFSVCDLDDDGVKLFYKIYTNTRASKDDQEEFIRLLKSQNLLAPDGIARNPLWLKTIIASDLYIRNKAFLFKSYSQKLLQDELRSSEKNTEKRRKYPAWKEVVPTEEELRSLATLALAMHLSASGNKITIGYHDETGWTNGRHTIQRSLEGTHFAADDVIWEAQAANLLRVIPARQIEFSHQLLQEYFAACALTEQPGWHICLENCEKRAWWQTLFFFAGNLEQEPEKLSQFFKQLLAIEDTERIRTRLFVALGMLVSVNNPRAADIELITAKFREVFGTGLAQEHAGLVHELLEKLGDEAANAFAFVYFDLLPQNKILGANLLCSMETRTAARILLDPLRDEMGTAIYSPILAANIDAAFFAINFVLLGQVEILSGWQTSPEFARFIQNLAASSPEKFARLPDLVYKQGFFPKDSSALNLLKEILGRIPTKKSVSLLLDLIKFEQEPKDTHIRDYLSMQSLEKIAAAKPDLVLRIIFQVVFDKDEFPPFMIRELFSSLEKHRPLFTPFLEGYLEDKSVAKQRLALELIKDLNLSDLSAAAQRYLLDVLEKDDNVIPISAVLPIVDDMLENGFLDAGYLPHIKALALKLAQDRRNDARRWAAILLKHACFEGVEDVLVGLARDRDENVRYQTIASLAKRKVNAVALLVEIMIGDKNSGNRYLAASALSGFPQSPTLTQALKQAIRADNDYYVRFYALDTLQNIDSANVTADLFQYLKPNDEEILAVIAQAISWKNQAMIDYFLDRLQDYTPRFWLQLEKFADFKDPRLLSAVIRVYTKDPFSLSRSIPGRLLASYGDEVIPLVVDGLTQSQTNRVEYFSILDFMEKTYGTRIIPYLGPLMGVEEPSHREEAARLFGRLKSAETTPILLNALEKEEDYAVALAIIAAVGEIADPRALPVLLKMLDENSHSSFDKISVASRFMNTIKSIQINADEHPHRSQKSEFLGEILEAIGKIEHTPSQEESMTLIRYLGDADPHLSFDASKALCRLGDARGVEVLVREAIHEERRKIRYWGYLKPILESVKPAAVGALKREILKNDFNAFTYENWLTELEPSALFEYYCGQLDNEDGQTRVNAVRYFRQVGDPRAVPVLEKAIRIRRDLWPGWSAAHEALEYLKQRQQSAPAE